MVFNYIALEDAQTELFDIKLKFDEEKVAK